MSNSQNAHRRSLEQARYAKHIERFQTGKNTAKKHLNEASTTHIYKNPSWFDKLWQKLRK